MLESIVDRRASALVTPLASGDNVVRRIFGDDLERIGRESPVPVLAVRPGQGPMSKVVLGLDSKVDSQADRYEQQLAVRVARALSGKLGLPLAVGARDEAAIDALGLPKVAEKVTGPRAIANHPEVLEPGSILVVPASVVRRYGPLAGEFERAHRHVTLVVVAGPYRLRMTLGPRTASFMGAGSGPDAVAEAQGSLSVEAG